MARSYANIRVNMWSDEDWRELSGAAKLLYITLLCHDTLNYAGVADWRPGKIAPLIDPRWSAGNVREAAAELSRAFFVVISEESEEILIRSFVKHDGLMKQPKMAQAMTRAFASIASLELRQVLAFEVQKLRANSPELPCWGVTGIDAVLRHSAIDAQAVTPSVTPTETPAETLGVLPIADQAEGSSPTPTPTPTPKTSLPPSSSTKSASKRGTRIKSDWKPSPEDIATIEHQCPGYNWRAEHQQFVDYWLAKPGREGLKLEWGLTWRNWMRTNYKRLTPAEMQTLQSTTTRRRFNDDDD